MLYICLLAVQFGFNIAVLICSVGLVISSAVMICGLIKVILISSLANAHVSSVSRADILLISNIWRCIKIRCMFRAKKKEGNWFDRIGQPGEWKWFAYKCTPCTCTTSYVNVYKIFPSSMNNGTEFVLSGCLSLCLCKNYVELSHQAKFGKIIISSTEINKNLIFLTLTATKL